MILQFNDDFARSFNDEASTCMGVRKCQITRPSGGGKVLRSSPLTI